MDKQLAQLAQFVANASSVEELTRPLLQLIQQISGLESTYLTSIDNNAGLQTVNVVYNAGELLIPEGLTVSWSDTLCKRALESQCFLVENVPEIWGDSVAAKALNLQSYISVPIVDTTGAVVGTLCGASSKREQSEHLTEIPKLLQLCAELINQQLRREEAQKLAYARAETAEKQLGRVQLLSSISEFCVAAQSLSLAVSFTANYMHQSGYWHDVVPFEIVNSEFISLDAAHKQWQKPLQTWLASVPVAKQHFNVVYLPELQRPAIANNNIGILVNVYVNQQAIAALLVLVPKETQQPENSALLSGISNALSLLAARLDEHQKLIELNHQFSFHALHDPLTSLPNRRFLVEELRRQMARASRKVSRFCLMFIDLDKFKAINDQYGHETGDEFLCELADRLKRSLRDGDFVARQGGDEFVLLCQLQERPLDESAQLVRRVRQQCSGLFYLTKYHIIYSGPSIGVVFWQSGDSLDVDSLLSQADAAMYRDKKQRRLKPTLE